MSSRPLLPGSPAPEFKASGMSGSRLSFSPKHLERPVVVTFFRGGWCPYCVTQFSGLRKIEAELVEEERALTQQRETTPPEEFAELANAFDRKVQQVRETQDGKSIQLQQRLEQERQTFLAEAGPVIATLVRRRGAFVVLDRSEILLTFEGVDITEEAIAAIDAAIGSGSSEKLAPPAQLSRPDGEGE